MDGSLAANYIKNNWECVFDEKNILSVVLMLAVAIAMIAGGTMAWFSASFNVPNAILAAGAGTVSINVDMLSQGQQTDIGTVIEDNWAPGTTETVSWKIVNTGKQAMVFRFCPEVEVRRLRTDFNYSILPDLPNPWNGENLSGIINSNGASEEDWIVENGEDENNWNERIYYYLPVVEAGEEVTLNMDITLKGEETGNEYQAASFIIGGLIEAVQAAGNAPFEIWGVDYYDGSEPTPTPTPTPPAEIDTYYVDINHPQASNDNPGTEELPFASIPYGISKLQPGNTLYVKEGTYEGDANIIMPVVGVTGTPDAWINIMAYPGDNVILRGNGVNSGRVKFSDCHYVKISGFEVTNYNQGIWICGGSSNVIVDNVEVHHVGQELMSVKENSSYITVQNSIFHDARQWNYNGEGVYVGTGSGGPLDNTHHVTIRNNIIYNCTDEGIEFKPGTHDCIAEGNTIYNTNTLLGNNAGAIEISAHTAGVQYWDSNPSHIIRNNIIYNVKCGIMLETGTLTYNNVIYDLAADGYGILVRNNESDAYTRQIYHNTINAPDDNEIYVHSGAADIRNNIGPDTANNMAADDTYFVDAESNDFHLVSGSAPIDAGQDVGIAEDKDGATRPQGSGYDYGAYECPGPVTYYLDNDDPNAADTNSGTEEAPWKTISYALSQLQPGDTLYIKEGDYNGDSAFFFADGLSGTAEEWINILAYPEHDVVLSGLGVNTGRVKFTNCHYVLFSGVKVTNHNQGIFIEGGSSNITLDNLEVHHVGQEAIHIHQNSSYITVQNSSIHDTRQWTNNGEGIYIGTGSSGDLDNTHHITIRNNTIYNVTDEAIELKPGTHDCVVEGNTIYNACTALAAYPTTGAICVNPRISGNQIWEDNPNHIIRNNIVHTVATAGIELRTGCKVYNNVIYDLEENKFGIVIRDLAGDGYTKEVYHNTVHSASSAWYAIHNYEGGAVIKNNIGPSEADNIVADDSYFVDAASGDFRLVSGSAPIDAGQDVGIYGDIDGVVRPQGAGYDYGAYEYVAE